MPYYQEGTQPPYQNFLPNQAQGQMTIPSQPTPSQPEYAENLLQKNIGKRATFYMSYSDSIEWRDRIFTGIIEEAGQDYVLLHNQDTGKWTILWAIYLNFVEFDEPLNR